MRCLQDLGGFRAPSAGGRGGFIEQSPLRAATLLGWGTLASGASHWVLETPLQSSDAQRTQYELCFGDLACPYFVRFKS